MAESVVTNKMLFAAVRQAVEEKLLPKHAPIEIYEQHYASMQRIIEAAINAKED
jgi:hypothetical protein